MDPKRYEEIQRKARQKIAERKALENGQDRSKINESVNDSELMAFESTDALMEAIRKG